MRNPVALSFALFGAAMLASGAPSLNGIFNAAGWVPPGLPSSGIAQGSMFTLTGTGLGPANLVQAHSYPLPTTQGLGGTSVKITLGGVTKDCIMVYSLATQVAAIVPSSTPTGSGQVTLTFQGAQANIPVTVVAGTLGLLTLNSAGSGPGLFTDTNYKVITLVHSAHPGDVITAWGTGLGAVTGDETQPPASKDLHNVKMFVGGQSAKVNYGGRGGVPALDQINFVVPNGLSGCKVSVVGEVAGIPGNFATLPVAPAGQSVCTDEIVGLKNTDIEKAQANGKFSAASINLNRFGTSADKASAGFTSMDFNSLLRSYGLTSFPSVGNCVVYELLGSKPTIRDPEQGTPLDAGPDLTVTGSDGTMKTLNMNATGDYSLTLGGGQSGQPAFLNPGNFSITDGSGGTAIGPFNPALTLDAPVTFIPPASITRSQDLTLSWSGSAGSSVVLVIGLTSVPITSSLTSFTELQCSVDASATQFTIPSSALLALPTNGIESAGLKGIDLGIGAVPGIRFQAKNLDVGIFSILIWVGGYSALL